MAKNDKIISAEQAKLDKSNNQLDIIAQKILSNVDTGYAERQRLAKSDTRMQRALQRELNIANNKSHGSFIDFIRLASSDTSKKSNTKGTGVNKGKSLTTDPYDLFTTNAGDIFNYFKENNQSKYLQISDLKFVSKFVPILGAAVDTALNSITASDTISDTIARQIILPDMDDIGKQQVTQFIEAFERTKKLPRKLKNIAFKKAIVSGESYIYAIEYQELFKEYDRVMAKREEAMKNGNKVVKPTKSTESIVYGDNIPATETFLSAWDYTVGAATEACVSEDATNILIDRYSKQLLPPKKGAGLRKDAMISLNGALESDLRSFIEGFKIVDSTIPYPCMEDAKIYQIEEYRKTFGGNAVVQNDGLTSEVAVDPGKRQKNNWDDLNGLYIKFIDAKNLIPVKIFDRVSGYFYLYPTERRGTLNGFNKTDIFNTGNSPMLSYINISQRKKQDAALNLVSEISQLVLDSFSSKFVTAHSEYVDLIADVIIANGLIDRDYKIQFIPAEYIVPFKINEDENGNGESIIADSLFSAKMLLYLLTSQLLNFLNLSGNRQIAHIAKGPIDVNTSNHIQDVIRNLQETKISFNDLLSTNLVYSKLSRNVNLALPQARNGTHLVEFETQEGQDVNMDTDMIDKLEGLVSLGTKVPITKDMLSDPQRAKKLESENITYAGSVASWQADLEGPLTDLYKKAIHASNLPDNLKTICENGLEIKLPRPKAFENTNNADFLSTAVSMLQQAAGAYVGENSTDPNAMAIRDKLVSELIRDITPFIDWNKMDEVYKRIEVNIVSEKAKNTDAATGGGFDSGGDEF